jgi:hypothetical protein
MTHHRNEKSHLGYYSVKVKIWRKLEEASGKLRDVISLMMLKKKKVMLLLMMIDGDDNHNNSLLNYSLIYDVTVISRVNVTS